MLVFNMVVKGSLQWRAPPILILAILLVLWNQQLKHSEDLRLILTQHGFSYPPRNEPNRRMYSLCPTFLYFNTSDSQMLTKDRHFCELFAGRAAVSTAMRAVPCYSNYVCRLVKLLNSNPNRNAGPQKPASACKASLEADFVGTSMDINLSSAFDMLTAAGMSFLELVSKLILLVVRTYHPTNHLWSDCHRQNPKPT